MTAPLSNNNPHIPAIEGAKEGLQSFVMYYYKALIDAGYDVNSAKKMTAQMIEKEHEKYVSSAGIPTRSIASVQSRIDKAMKIAEVLAQADGRAKALINELIMIQMSLEKKQGGSQ